MNTCCGLSRLVGLSSGFYAMKIDTRKTAEQAEEAMMETETVQVTTEQPSPAEALAVNSTGAERPAEAAAAGDAIPDDHGTPVDNITIGAKASSVQTVAKADTVPTGTDSVDNGEQKGDNDKAEESRVSSAKVENEVKGTVSQAVKDLKASSETDAVLANTGEQSEQVQTEEKAETEAKNVKVEEISFDRKENGSNLESSAVVSADRLERLAQQIDDFDVVLETGRPDIVNVDDSNGSDESGNLTSDLTDDIIDELIEEASNVTHIEVDKSVVNASKTDAIESEKQVLSDDGLEEGEVTPAVSDEVSDKTKIAESGSLSTVEASENDAESRVNGKSEESMSASTESEGFADEKVNSENPEQSTEPRVAEADSTTNQDRSTKKADEKKTENSSPVKTAKSKKKEDKSIEHILKALSSLQTTEEKLAALCKKYADLHEDHRVLQATFKQSQRKLTVISREKDQLQTEHTKAVMAKSKLESLCRELQKHNQTIRQESLQRAKEEDEKRKEISQKFQTTIGEIQQQMQENHDRNKQLREENFELANKLKKFIEQYEAREKQVEKVIQHRELEQKLADAKLEQANAILMEEKTRSQKERELLLLQTADSMKKIQLKDAELKMYKERYEEFQSTIKRSEEMFNKFKTEMDKMTKRCKKLDKETAQWKGKWENANRALLEMAEEKQRYDKEKGLLMTKISKLESLCRAMQAERKARKLLENEGVDMSSLTLGDSTPPLLEPQVAIDPDESAPTPSPVSMSPIPATQTAEQECVAKSTIEDIDEDDDDDDDSDLSSASETTGVTVIQPDSQTTQPPDTSQTECMAGEDSQSEISAKPVTDQSEASTESINQSEGDAVSTAS